MDGDTPVDDELAEAANAAPDSTDPTSPAASTLEDPTTSDATPDVVELVLPGPGDGSAADSGGDSSRAFAGPESADDIDSSVTATAEGPTQSDELSQTVGVATVADALPANLLVTEASAAVPAKMSAEESAAAQPALTVAEVATPAVKTSKLATALRTLLNPSPKAPNQGPLLALLAWVRREFQQAFSRNSSTLAPQQGIAQVDAAPVVFGPNLVTNGGAEFGDPDLTGYASVTVPGWTVAGTPTVIQYGTIRRFPWPLSGPGPVFPSFLGFPRYNGGSLPTAPNSGAQFFGGGPDSTTSLTQIIDLSGAGAQIDLGGVAYQLDGDLGGFFIDPSRASVTVNFLAENGAILGSGSLKAVTALNRWFRTGFIHREASGIIPVGTRSAQMVVNFKDLNPVLGNYNNAYADNLSFTVSADLPAPPPPTPPVSTVGELDHAFVVFMENKGYTNITGSPNAPFINYLIDTYGTANNYFGLTHPSLPNYTATLGGSNFNVNYNCAENCFDERNLTNTITEAGKSWAAYEQNGGGYTAAGELGFLAFANIYNNPEIVNSNILPLTQMGTDLASPSTAPNFAWIAADEDNNMEGPIDTIVGVLSFIVTQFTNQQYNIKAGDQFIAETLPIIMTSETWLDPTQKSAIFLTWDEDNNNLSLGFGNQGNHVQMIVIPSPGAVAGGMRSGTFVAQNHYNHYSLLRTIEEALGLEPLTQNDRYAVPMNEFWT